jgi:hypothetical protein
MDEVSHSDVPRIAFTTASMPSKKMTMKITVPKNVQTEEKIVLIMQSISKILAQ